MKHRVLTFSWCKISLKLTNCWEIFWFLNRLYWMRNRSVEKFSAGSTANWVNSWWADHVTAGEGWRHVRVKPPVLEQPLIKHHLPGAGSWAEQERQRLAPRGCPDGPASGAGSWEWTQPKLLSRLLAAAIAEADKSGRLRQEPKSGPKSASKFQADVRCGSRRKIARGAACWNRRPGTCARVFCWRGLCQRRAPDLRNCWFKLTLDLL